MKYSDQKGEVGINSPGTIVPSGVTVFERMLKYFEQKPMMETRECKLQNFISFLMVLTFFENFEKFS